MTIRLPLRSSPSAGLLAALLLSAGCGGDARDAYDLVAEEDSALHAEDGPGAVYTLTNDATRNAVAVFRRAADGTLTAAGTYGTGGRGTGAGLGSQGALGLARGGRFLLAVNAGSHEISVFRVWDRQLELTDRVPSRGEQPICLTTHGAAVYVLNAGGSGGLAGFHLTGRGRLVPLPGSMRPLSGAAVGPAQVSFSPDGRELVVTEKATSRIDTYEVDGAGRAGPPRPQPSAGQTPFGFAFDGRGRLFVSEAFGGMADQSALSSYAPERGGALRTLSASVPTTETAACWVVVTDDGRHVYTTNTGSSSITGYRISAAGTLARLSADGVTGQTGAGSRPIDAALSAGSHYLYALSAGTNQISAFAIDRDGALTALGARGGLPAGTVGLAAR